MNEERQNKIRQFYNGLANQYDEEQDSKSFEFIRKPEKEMVFKYLNPILTKNDKVLEIGAGTGRFTLEIAPKVSQIEALDLSEQMLSQLSQKIEMRNLSNIQIINSDVLQMSVQGLYDIVVSFSVIEYIKEKDLLFQRLSEILKPGGKLIITTAHKTFFRFFGRLGNYFRQGYFMKAYSKKELTDLLKKNSFNILHIQDTVLKTWISKGILLLVVAEKNRYNS